MARCTLDLQMTFTPAYFALVEVVTRIAESHGQERATAWAEEILSAYIELFVQTEVQDRPLLRLVKG
jgi:hypothetical protein